MTTWYIEYTFPYINVKWNCTMQGCITTTTNKALLTLDKINEIKEIAVTHAKDRGLPKDISADLQWTHTVLTLVVQISNEL